MDRTFLKKLGAALFLAVWQHCSCGCKSIPLATTSWLRWPGVSCVMNYLLHCLFGIALVSKVEMNKWLNRIHISSHESNNASVDQRQSGSSLKECCRSGFKIEYLLGLLNDESANQSHISPV